MRGFAAENATYANGWTPPANLPTSSLWTVAHSMGGGVDGALNWFPIAGVRAVEIEGAGVLPQFTHPRALVRLLA